MELGQQFGALTVQSLVCLWDRQEYANCRCICGNGGMVLVSLLENRKVDSCGAMPRVESAAKIKIDCEKREFDEMRSRLGKLFQASADKYYRELPQRRFQALPFWNRLGLTLGRKLTDWCTS